MKINEIINEADQSRRGFLGMLGKGAAATAIASSGLGGVLGGAKDAEAAQGKVVFDVWIATGLGRLTPLARAGLLTPKQKAIYSRVLPVFKNYLRELRSNRNNSYLADKIEDKYYREMDSSEKLVSTAEKMIRYQGKLSPSHQNQLIGIADTFIGFLKNSEIARPYVK